MRAITGLDYVVGPTCYVGTAFYTGTTLTDAQNLPFDLPNTTDQASIIVAIESAINTYATAQSYTLNDGIIWAGPMASVRSFSTPSRSLDTAYQPSATRDTFGSWSVAIASNLSLSGGQLGSIQLQTADDSGFTTNVATMAESQNGNTGALTIGLNTVQTQGTTLTGIIPAGKYFRLHSVDTTGTPTQTSVRAQEVLL